MRPEQLALPAIGEIDAERERIRVAARGGTTCRCCGQHVEVHRRHLNSTMARCLLGLIAACAARGVEYSHPRDVPIGPPRTVGQSSINDILGRASRTADTVGGEFAKLAHWGLIAASDQRGFWRPTDLGHLFAQGKTEVPEWVELLVGRVVDRAPNLVDINDALGKRHSLAKVARIVWGRYGVPPPLVISDASDPRA